jgi:3-isopropylmalate/(R)-2-methylmalate dehydratase large subunit
MTPRNIIEKIWDAHVVTQAAGHPAVFAIDLMLLHEVTSAQAFAALGERGLEPYDRGALVATLDHSIPTRKNRLEIYDEAARTQVETLRKNAATYGVPIFDFGSGHQGIVHVIGPELGMTQPGMTICCGDSHTSTHGAFGAMAFGIGTSEVAHVLAAGCLLQDKPRTMKVEFRGSFRPGVFAKDAILNLIARIGIGGANGHVIEYSGEAISCMSMEERMTMCNMSIECGARAGLVAPDETTFTWLRGKPYAPKDSAWESAIAHWKSFRSESGASFDREVLIDLSALRPMVTWGTNPGQAIQIGERIPRVGKLPDGERMTAEKALQYVKLAEGAPIEGTPVEWGFIGSCTNGRIGDLRIAASVLRGKKIHPGVTLLVVPGSEEVLLEARAEGLDAVFAEAGADFRMPGCSMCLGMNDDKVPPGKRCISSSNRNFVGRQGTGSYTHLASPATVAASVIAGKITSPEAYFA